MGKTFSAFLFLFLFFFSFAGYRAREKWSVEEKDKGQTETGSLFGFLEHLHNEYKEGTLYTHPKEVSNLLLWQA